MRGDAHRLSRYWTDFTAILLGFVTLTLVSWPILFSFELWVFGDRANLLHLDHVLDTGLRLGVDAYFAYGLLPVLIQRMLFTIFGRGYWPLIGCTVIYMVLSAAFWAALLRHMPRSMTWLVAIVAMSPILLWVNPNLPYCFVVLSIFYSLLFVLLRRLDIALAIAVVGWLSVPSLPLVLIALLVVLIFLDWWISADRSITKLFRQFLPAGLTYLILISILSAVFSFESVLATAMPFQGVQHYRTMQNYNVSQFLFPASYPNPSIPIWMYFVFNRQGWWIVSTIVIFGFGLYALATMVRRRALDPTLSFILLCAILHGVFAFVAYGPRDQHIIYDPLLTAGVFIGLAALPLGRARNQLLVAFLGVSVVAQGNDVHDTWLAWTRVRDPVLTPSLYADRAWTAEWSKVLELSAKRQVFYLSYSTGVSDYFPTLHTADVWSMNAGQLFDADKQRVFSTMRRADVVVQDMQRSAGEADIRRELSNLCLKSSTVNFQVWEKKTEGASQSDCDASP